MRLGAPSTLSPEQVLLETTVGCYRCTHITTVAGDTVCGQCWWYCTLTSGCESGAAACGC